MRAHHDLSSACDDVVVLLAAALVGCGSATPSATVPNVVGQALDAAKSVLVTAGFPAESQDLLRGRNPLLDSDWTVCTQTPGPVARPPRAPRSISAW